MLLGGGMTSASSTDAGNGLLFFGSVSESIRYFHDIGYNIPEDYTPTDIYLQLTDYNFGTNQDFDFEGAFAASSYSRNLKAVIEEYTRMGREKIFDNESSNDLNSKWKPNQVDKITVSTITAGDDYDSDDMKRIQFLFWRQYTTLVARDFTLARRDPSLYYLQFGLATMFGFMIGAAYLNVSPTIDNSIGNVSAALLWIVLPTAYLHVFKVYHLSRANQIFNHEAGNNTFNLLARWLAELTSTLILLVIYIPGTISAYFMMNLPGVGYPFLALNFWMTAVTSESMLNFITKFSDITTVSIVTCQAVLVILTVFGGGVFISWRDCPIYWRWLQELSIFTQASRAAIMDTNDYLEYYCVLNSNQQCIGPTNQVFPCDVYTDPDFQYCYVSGRTVLQVTQGTIRHESKWVTFGYLCLIFGCFRLGLLFLMYYPPKKIGFAIREWLIGDFSRGILESLMGLRRVEREFHAYLKKTFKDSNYFANDKLINDYEEKATGHLTSLSKLKSSRRITTEMETSEELDELFKSSTIDVSFSKNLLGSTSKQVSGSSLQWNNLSVVLPSNGAVLIDNVSGIAQPQRVLALMGPSGAGKTTLLNALSQRSPYAKISGQVLFGNRPMTAEDLVYVPQFDEFNANLTVFEQIEFVGLMKCADVKSMYKRLITLLRILGLADRRDTRCSKLTSGQLKRVSVGMGMISKPNVLFLDEPTTGLDSAAFSIVKHITELSVITKVVVILTIHQPAQIVFDMLRDLYLLETGRLAYFGPLQATKKYFALYDKHCPPDVNPADFYLDIVNQPPKGDVESVTWGQLYTQSTFAQNFKSYLDSKLKRNQSNNKNSHSNDNHNHNDDDDDGNVIESEVSPNAIQRFWYITDFFVKYYSRDIGFYPLRIVYLVVVALFCGTLFLQLEPKTAMLSQYSGAIFFSIWTVLFSAVAATGLLAADRRLAIEQVKNAVMTPSVYCLAQFVVSIPLNFICALIFQAIFYWMIDLNPKGEPFIYSVLLETEHMLMMEALMLTVVAVLKNAMLSVTFAMVLMGFLFLFSGFFILIPNMPKWVNWIAYTCPTFYSLQGYLWKIFDNQMFEVSGSGGEKVAGDVLLKEIFGLRAINSWAMFGVMVGWILLFRLFHYGAFLFDVYPYLRKAQPSVPLNIKAVSDASSTKGVEMA